MAHPVPTKGFLQLSSEAAMLPGPSVETRPSPPVPPFRMAQNLSLKEVTSQAESCMMHICVYHIRIVGGCFNRFIAHS